MKKSGEKGKAMKKGGMMCWRWWTWSLLAAGCFCVVIPQSARAIVGPYLVEDVAGQKTVLDQGTGLEWQQADDGMKRNWQEAVDYCENLDFGGHADWRLPHIKELQSIVDHSRFDPAIDTTVFQSKSDDYWSFTTVLRDFNHYKGRAWGVNFYYGYGGLYAPWYSKADYSYARCVRDQNYHGAIEICDGIDNDGDGQIDEGFDQDQDGFTICANDCNDSDPAINPNAGDSACNGIDDNCDGEIDEGFTPAAVVCGVGECLATGITACENGIVIGNCIPGQPNAEICDGLDNDCDGMVDDGLSQDQDGDGHTAIGSCQGTADDCNDSDPAVKPAAIEICDGLDNNCDNEIDEVCGRAECRACHGDPPLPLTHAPAPTGSRTAGAHQLHNGYDCLVCHDNNGLPIDAFFHANAAIQIGFAGPVSGPAPCSGEPADIAGNAYFAQKTVADNGYRYEGTGGAVVITPDDPNWIADREMTCANIYCHSQGKRLRQGYDLPSVSPSWRGENADPQNDGERCNNCHGYPPSFDSHAYHASRRFGCELCHADTTTDGRSISDPARHANGVYDVKPAKAFYARQEWHILSFVYSSSDSKATCSVNTCHQYFSRKEQKDWINREQVIADASLSVLQGACLPPASGQPLAAETVTVDVRAACGSCVGPYTCDFDWGDGLVETDVACATTHTYADKIPPANDPLGTVIGAFDVTWSIHDAFGVTLSGCSRTTRVQVCPLPDVEPVVQQRFAVGPAPQSYDLCLQDLSIDPDYNLGTHYDPNGIAPGTIRIEWGFVVDQPDNVTEMPIMLTDQPSGEVFCHTYPRRDIYLIRHGIRDNHGGQDFIMAPPRRVKVMLNSIELR